MKKVTYKLLPWLVLALSLPVVGLAQSTTSYSLNLPWEPLSQEVKGQATDSEVIINVHGLQLEAFLGKLNKEVADKLDATIENSFNR